ncbi:MAG: 8-amino-7-oxononanoate synthase [bacterium]|nr:8-amino-7-oxononanoate synthase [bacterium]
MLREPLRKFLHRQIVDLKEAGCYRQMKLVDSAAGARVFLQGREVINFSSNNYLGLASSGFLKQAAAQALSGFGIGAGASRLVGGNFPPHEELEKKLANFKKTESALVFNCGYMANCGLISALCQREDLVFSDRLNHASIVDGVLLSRAKLVRYNHRDMEDLRRLLARHSGGRGKRLIVTDSLFSMDGDLAPLREIVDLAAEFEASVMVDEAHATGVLGEHGRGAVELFGLEGEIDIQMGTLSKALGAFGAYVAGDSLLIDFLINRARPFIFTTALPPPAVAAASMALDIVDNRPDLRDTLLRQAAWFRQKLQESGFNTLNSQTHIIPILVGDNERALSFSQKLLEAGIYAPAIRPPAVPRGGARLRISLIATHTLADLEEAADKIQRIGQELRLI